MSSELEAALHRLLDEDGTAALAHAWEVPVALERARPIDVPSDAGEHRERVDALGKHEVALGFLKNLIRLEAEAAEEHAVLDTRRVVVDAAGGGAVRAGVDTRDVARWSGDNLVGVAEDRLARVEHLDSGPVRCAELRQPEHRSGRLEVGDDAGGGRPGWRVEDGEALHGAGDFAVGQHRVVDCARGAARDDEERQSLHGVELRAGRDGVEVSDGDVLGARGGVVHDCLDIRGGAVVHRQVWKHFDRDAADEHYEVELLGRVARGCLDPGS